MLQAHSRLTAVVRLLGFVAWTLVMIPPQALFLSVGHVAMARRNARVYWSGVRRILGITVTVRGAVSERRPTLFVANHASYLDVVVLGSLVEAAFVARQDVRNWPGFNIVAWLGRTVFVDRRPRKSLVQRDEMLARFSAKRESLILFPEGTSNDGNRLLPFKSALFSTAEIRDGEGRPLPVQPVSVAYTHLDGMPMGRALRPFYAWYGDMELVPHLWVVLGLGNIAVEVEFHPPVSLEEFTTRRALADYCHAAVGRGLTLANAGRLHLPAPVTA